MDLEQPVSQDRDCLWRNTRKKLNFLEFSECWGDLRDAYWALCVNVVVVQSLIVSYSLQLHGLGQAPLSFTVSQSLFKFMFIESVILSKHHPLLPPFSFCLQSFPASGSFPRNQLLTSGGQSVGATATASVLPMNNQGWFLLRLIGLISFQSKRISRVFSSIKSINFSALSLPYGPTLTSIHGYWKNHTFDYTDLYRQSDVFAFSVYCLSLS